MAALADGRVITGLPVEDTPDELVIKTADGQRVSVEPRSVEDRRTSDVSLMPEGLAQTMTTQEVVDLLSYLTTLAPAGEHRWRVPGDRPALRAERHAADRSGFRAGSSYADCRRAGPPAFLAQAWYQRRRAG